MSISSEILRLQGAKTDIKTAIESKGVTVPSSATIDTYADYVSQISGGGGIQMPSKLDDATLNDYGLLTSATIKSGVTSIGDYAFQNCSSLESIEIPDSVTSISDYVFNNCTSLTSCTIGSGVTSIGDSAFRDCTSLTSIEIPNSVTSIGQAAFFNCNSLTSITIPSGVTSIYYSTFEECTSLTSITIPSGVTSIYDNAFVNCSSLTSLAIPDSVTSIGAAFQNCTSLTSCTIGSGVTDIYDYAFQECTSLTSIAVLADMPPYLGSDVFTNTNDCPIYVPSGSVSDYQEAWSDYASRIQAIPSSSYKWVATYSGGATTSAECDTTFAIVSGEINLTNLESVEIGDCVTRINQGAFQNCSSITSCTIGSGVTSMGSDVFNYTNASMSLTIYATTPPTLSGHIFTGPNAGIFVPSESVNAYKSAPIWSFYAAGIQAIPNS